MIVPVMGILLATEEISTLDYSSAPFGQPREIRLNPRPLRQPESLSPVRSLAGVRTGLVKKLISECPVTKIRRALRTPPIPRCGSIKTAQQSRKRFQTPRHCEVPRHC